MRLAMIAALFISLLGAAPAENNAPQLAAGRAAFKQYCAACHNDDATGSIGPSLLPSRKFTYGRDPKSLYKSIAEGHRKGCPAWKSVLSDKDIRALVLYVQSLKAPAPQPSTSPR